MSPVCIFVLSFCLLLLWLTYGYISYNVVISSHTDNVNSHFDVCYRNERCGAGGRELLHDIKVKMSYILICYQPDLEIFGSTYSCEPSMNANVIRWKIVHWWKNVWRCHSSDNCMFRSLVKRGRERAKRKHKHKECHRPEPNKSYENTAWFVDNSRLTHVSSVHPIAMRITIPQYLFCLFRG